MAGSSALDILFISVNHSITLIGKVWLIVMIFLRVLILVFAGYPLYQDEQERFVCNTIQPGCANVCYDLFAPVSLFRFWLVQLVALCLPYLVFVVYVVHKVSNALAVDLDARALQLSGRKSSNKAPLLLEKAGSARCFAGAYVLQLVLRTLLEAGFGAAHYYLFGFYVSRRFLCGNAPCTTQVDCYISRPTEKTVMLNFMLGVAALSLFLNVVDFICAIKRSVRQKSKRKLMAEKMLEEEEERCFLSVGGMSGRTEPDRPHAPQEAPPGRTGSFRKRQGSRGSGAGLDLGPEPPLAPSCNTNANNGCSVSQDGSLERNGSEVALCPQDLLGTPRPIRVSKRSLHKPPPPPRRNLALPPAGPSGRDNAATAAVCARRVGQCTLVELGRGAELQTGEDGQEKRSEWV